ncbi:MAG TPA: cellulase family glycosylhydrolase [Candidatus Eisenbacteria bacterium]|nr:cellulase family glycosylhydrolase [Candidatus Eisenbacteria bacterium]
MTARRPSAAPTPPTPAPAKEKTGATTERQGIGIAALVFVALLVGLFFIDLVKENLGLEEAPTLLGATFSKPYAESLGLDWKEAYLATLDDLGVRRFRIPAYWNDIEPEPGVFNFANVDWQVEQAAKRGGKVILAVGRKLPRWPECHAPAWTEGMNESLVQTRILTMMETVVRHYADEPAIIVWQVENEPFFEFGKCPPPDREFLKHEVAVVRAIDKRPIMITESGELSSWLQVAGIADILGISTYRTVWDRYIGYFYWPISPRVYARRYDAVSTLIDRAIISELQAEPWAENGITSMPIDQQLHLMNPTRLIENVRFARKVGFSEAYLWGVEWWYWLRAKGHPELWDAGKQVFGGK